LRLERPCGRFRRFRNHPAGPATRCRNEGIRSASPTTRSRF